MFVLTGNILFTGFKEVKPGSLKWKLSVDDYCDTASITLPAMCRMVDKERNHSTIPTGQAIKEGTPVAIYAGYDGKNDLQFKGFVSRINFKVPVEIDCEGYSWQLRRKMINKTFARTTVKEVLNFIIAGTDIKLSAKNPDKIIFEHTRFENYTALQVLDFLKEKYLLTVFFQYDELYVGWRSAYTGNEVKHRLNWNVIKDDSLLFNTYTGTTVHIELESRKADGTRGKKRAQNVMKPGDVKKVKTFIQDDDDKQLAADDRQQLENKKGYSGALTGYLKPFCRPGDTSIIIDKKYQERNGRYFIDSVEGSFGSGGGRQKIAIGFALK